MMPNSSNIVLDLVSNILPFDALEKNHIQDTLSWIRSGAPLFRISKPDIPDKHLVSYFVVFDVQAEKILLVEHKNAWLWLPPGGHVEIDENPIDTVKRECYEELGVEANFMHEFPIFITSTITVGLTAGHTDVSLWYLLRGNNHENYMFDADEFNSIKWFSINEIPYNQTDPHMHRFISKLIRNFL